MYRMFELQGKFVEDLDCKDNLEKVWTAKKISTERRLGPENWGNFSAMLWYESSGVIDQCFHFLKEMQI